MTFTSKAVLALAVPIVVGVMSARFVRAQSSAQQPKPLTFEAASVKLARAPNGVTVSGGKMMASQGSAVQIPRNTGGPGTDDPGRIHYPFISLKELLGRAWSTYSEIESPGWLDSQTVAVDATMPRDTTKAQFEEMLRNLITARFGLKYHVESKEIAGYSLVVAKNGPKMKESADQNGGDPKPPTQSPTGRDSNGFLKLPPRPGSWCTVMETPGDRQRIVCQQKTMQDLARVLGDLRSTVDDATGLKARYDFTLTYAGGRPGSAPASSEPTGLPEGAEPLPDIFSALQSQLGLKLDPRKVPVEVMVVDHMEKAPLGN